MRWILFAIVLLAPATVAAQSIVYPLPNQVVAQGERIRVDVVGEPGSRWTVFVGQVAWEAAVLNDDGRYTFHVPPCMVDRCTISAESEDSVSEVVVRTSPDATVGGPAPPEIAPPSLGQLAILHPEPGGVEESTEVVVMGPPGEVVNVSVNGLIVAHVVLDSAGLATTTVELVRIGKAELAAIADDTSVSRTIVAPIRAADASRRTAKWRPVRMGIASVLAVGVGIFAYVGLATGPEDARNYRRAALVSAIAIPVATYFPYAWSLDIEYFVIAPIATGLSIGLWALSDALSDSLTSPDAPEQTSRFRQPDTDLPYIALPFVVTGISLTMYELLANRQERESWRVGPGPGDVGVAVGREW